MVLKVVSLFHTSHNFALICSCLQPFGDNLFQTSAAWSVDLDAVDEATDTGNAARGILSLLTQLLVNSHACHDITKSFAVVFMVIVEGEVRPLRAAQSSLGYFVADVHRMAHCRNLVAEEH